MQSEIRLMSFQSISKVSQLTWLQRRRKYIAKLSKVAASFLCVWYSKGPSTSWMETLKNIAANGGERVVIFCGIGIYFYTIVLYSERWSFSYKYRKMFLSFVLHNAYPLFGRVRRIAYRWSFVVLSLIVFRLRESLNLVIWKFITVICLILSC